MQNNNHWKQSLHLEPTKGWLNDPNGLAYFKGEYHIFYQYSYEVEGGLKYWYYLTSKDLINYTDKGVFLKPDTEFDSHGAYSGSANIEGNKLAFYYTGNVKYKGNYDYVHEGRGHNTVLFTTEDGVNFSEKKVLLRTEEYPNMSNHVRDPKIFEKNGDSYLVLGARDSKDYGCLLVYKNMEYFKTIYSDKNLGYMWECPDYFELNGEELFLFSPQGIAHMYPDNKNVYQIGYSVVSEGIENAEKIKDFKILDFGHDFYASQTFIDEHGDRVLYAWAYVPDSAYTNPTTKFGYQNCLTVPRVLSYKDGKLLQRIHSSVEKLYAEEIKENQFEEKAWYFKKEDGKDFSISVDTTSISYKEGKLSIEVNENGYGRDNRKFDLDVKDVEIIFDASSMEIFANGGSWTFTTRFYPENHNYTVVSDSHLARKINSINVQGE